MSTPQLDLTGKTLAQLFEAHASRDAMIQQLMAEQAAIHAEITTREQREMEARSNPDRSLDQGVRLG